MAKTKYLISDVKRRCPFLCRPTLCQLLLTLFLPSLRQCLRNHRLQLSTKEDLSQPASQSIPPKPASVPEDTPASPLKSTEADSSQPAYNSIPPKPASLPEKSPPSSLKSTEEDSSEPTSHSIQKPASVPEKASPSSLKSTEADSSQSSTKVGSSFASSSHSSSFTSSFKPALTSGADSFQPVSKSIQFKSASMPDAGFSDVEARGVLENDGTFDTFCDKTLPILVSEESKPSSLKSTEADSSLASAKVGYSFASSSHNSSFTSSFKPAPTSEALTSSSSTKPKPASVPDGKTKLSSTLNVLQSDLIGHQGMTN